ncbi:DHA2 family efflux MFS transporter permease subunit [Tessaracoccus antarcticus]|uniref:DHA2 family efflux MFS transporter permease subunit n=2 Tax=Tessaracoccus antarcticus TaxID=2479848 RepID=A0A3M0G9Y8_9ACTN|nr:DHA2 family efflux MFS transporter permease subunit [Tessaracoccus antarcticus]
MGSAAGRWILLVSILGSGLAGIDATVVNVALPAIGGSLGAGFTGLQWTVTAYTLTLAAFILLGGSLADRFGRRRMFIVGVVWFAAASMLCGLAPGIGTLIAARTLQGIGGALLTPGSLAILQATFAPGDRAKAIGAWSGLSGVATAIGPFLGGWLVEHASWRWVFLINAPVAALVVFLALRYVPESRDPAAAPRLDIAGAALGVVALGGITYGLLEQPSQGITALPVLGALVLGVAAGVAFGVVEWRSTSPMVPLDIFRSRQFTAANLVTFTVYGGFGAVFFLLIIQLQVVSGFSPLAAGVSILPITFIMLALSSASGALAYRIGPRLQMSVGPAVCALGLVLMLRIGPDASYVADVLPGVAVFGLGLAIMVAPLTATALSSAPVDRAGLASGVNNAVARAAGLLAIAVLPAFAGLGGDDYTRPEAFNAGFDRAMWGAVAVLLVGAAIAAISISNHALDEAGHTPGEPGEALRDVARIHTSPHPHPQVIASHCAVAAPPQLIDCGEGADDTSHR